MKKVVSSDGKVLLENKGNILNKVDLDEGLESSIMCDVSDMEVLLKR